VHEHIRGLREFDWRGYSCAVTAPKFHRFNLHQFDVPAIDELQARRDRDLVGVDVFAGELAELEDHQRPSGRF
jgi:hypothetical protein